MAGNADGKMKGRVLLVPEKRVCTGLETAPRSNRECRHLANASVRCPHETLRRSREGAWRDSDVVPSRRALQGPSLARIRDGW
jgi:hypothetical protein